MENKHHFRPEFWLIPTLVSDHPDIQPFDEKVYAVIHWFYKMKDGKCFASNKIIAEIIKPSDPQIRSVQNSLNHLEEYGFIRRNYKDESHRHRVEIIPLISYQLERTTERTKNQNVPQSVLERTTDDSQNEQAMTRTIIENKKNKQEHTAAHSAAGALVIEALIEVDPKNKTYYGNITQRKACDFLIEEYTLDVVLARIKVLSQTNKIPYFPSIRSPYDLKEKWVQLENAVERKRQEIKSKKVDVII